VIGWEEKKNYKWTVKYGVVFVSMFLCLFIISQKKKYTLLHLFLNSSTTLWYN
jgi:hypothetical protein